jgi:hypothetical protein
MSKKWYNAFITVDSPGEESAPPEIEIPIPRQPSASQRPSSAPSGDAARLVAEIAATVPVESTFKAPVSNPTSFQEIYDAAEIRTPAHGYTIEKVSTMLGSEHLKGLSPDVKRSSILVALEASGAKIEDVIQDAVRRDRALDSYERVLRRSLTDIQSKKAEENKQIEAEMNRMLADFRARIQTNNETLAKESERFNSWLVEKQKEEKGIADTVGYFVTENPISVGEIKDAPANRPASKA